MVWSAIPQAPWWSSFPWAAFTAVTTMAAALAAFLSAFFSQKSSAISLRQLETNERYTESHDRSVRANMFMAIAKEWSRVYKARNTLLSSTTVLTANDLYQKYGTKYRQFLQTDEWRQTLRPMCNFYEILGVMLEQKAIAPGPLFVLVTVDTFEAVDSSGARTPCPEGVMYQRLKGPIEYLRQQYRADIYEFYDKYLLVAYREYADRPQSNKRDLPGEAKLLVHSAIPHSKSFWARIRRGDN